MNNSVDYAEFKSKMVDLTLRNEDGGSETFAARIIEANEIGVMYKRKSQRVPEIANLDKILDCKEAVSARLRLVAQKKLKAIGEATVKRHLADYHGLTLSELNAMSEIEAMRRHDEIDHTDLGHNHTDEANESEDVQPRQTRADILARINAA